METKNTNKVIIHHRLFLCALITLIAIAGTLFVPKTTSAATFPLFPIDTTAPAAPTGLVVVPQDDALIASWAAASDNVGVTEYEIWRDGVIHGTTTKLTFSDYDVVPGQAYSYSVKAKDASDNYSVLSTSVAGTAASTNVWGETLPAIVDGGDASSIEMGMKFTPEYDGTITGVRFYKAAANTGTHVGNIWSLAGTNLGSVVFTAETASGWQQATFATPITVTAGTTYVVSYFAPNGHYSIDRSYFNTGDVETPYITVPKNTAGNENGVFANSGSSTFPNSNFNAGNYWVDVEFAPNASAPPIGSNTTPLSVTEPLEPAPLAKTGALVASTGSDGWRPIPYKGVIYNIGHHQEITSTFPAIYALDPATNQQIPGYPKTLNAGDPTMPTDLVSGSHNTEFLDRDGQFGPAGALYIGVQRMNQDEVGVACFNLETGTGCGYTATGNTIGNTAGVGGFNTYTLLSAGYEAEGVFHSLTSDGRLVRMDMASRTALAPINLNFPDTTDVNNSNGPTLYKVGNKLIAYIRYTASSNVPLHGHGVRLQCYDPATGAVCAGWAATPIALDSTINNPSRLVRGTIPMLTSTGQEDGFCTFWTESPSEGAYCFGLDGSSRTTPAALLVPVEQPNTVFDSAQLPGTSRLYIPYLTQVDPVTTVDKYLCFDWATMANCADFGDTPGTMKTWGHVNNANLATYGIVYDPETTCMLALGDRSWMVSFSASTGGAPCRALTYTTILEPAAAYCDGTSRATAWETLHLYNIDSSLINSALVTLRDENGAVIAGYEDVTLMPSSSLDISAIPLSGTTKTLSVSLALDVDSHWPWLNGQPQPSVTADFEGASWNLEAPTCTLSQLSSFAFEDKNNNGTRDAGEPPIPNVQVALLNEAGFTVAVVTAGSNGFYAFTGIAPGNYAVQFLTPSGYKSSPLTVGSGTGNTSDADPNNHVATRFVTLAAGNGPYVLGAGFVLPADPPAPIPGGTPESPNAPEPEGELVDTSSQLPLLVVVILGLLLGSGLVLQRVLLKK